MVSFRPTRRAASSPPTSWANATSPRSSTVGPGDAAATPNAVETVPSIPFAPRLASTRGGCTRAGKNVSTSRIGIDDATTSVASVCSGPTVLLIGDVALLHDVGGLISARRLGIDLLIVLLNNDGGGIFHFLPVAGERDAFEEHVATPHGADFAHAAALAGFEHERPRDMETFQHCLGRALSVPGRRIIELRTDREANVEVHRRVWESVRGAL